MTCQQLTDFLADYLDRSLDLAVRAAFERHLALCADCRNYLDSYRRTVDLSRHALASDDDARGRGVPEALILAILSARKGG